MPIMKCTKDGQDGWKWGDGGACIVGPGAREKVERIAAAIHSRSDAEQTYKPTGAMASAARRALKMRDAQPDSNKGMTPVGLARANQLINGENLSLDTVKRMYSFFSRHEVDKSSESWRKGNSKAEQAWLGWGGDAGYSWSKRIVESLENE